MSTTAQCCQSWIQSRHCIIRKHTCFSSTSLGLICCILYLKCGIQTRKYASTFWVVVQRFRSDLGRQIPSCSTCFLPGDIKYRITNIFWTLHRTTVADWWFNRKLVVNFGLDFEAMMDHNSRNLRPTTNHGKTLCYPVHRLWLWNAVAEEGKIAPLPGFPECIFTTWSAVGNAIWSLLRFKLGSHLSTVL